MKIPPEKIAIQESRICRRASFCSMVLVFSVLRKKERKENKQSLGCSGLFCCYGSRFNGYRESGEEVTASCFDGELTAPEHVEG